MDEQETLRRLAFLPILALAACKPPPTDADMLRELPETAPTFASDPLPSPDTEGAVWAVSARAQGRLIYGVPGEPALLALECIEPQDAEGPEIVVNRFSPADEGAGALLAFVGNGHIGRIAVDATDLGEDRFWQGQLDAFDEAWAPLAGPRELTVTVPGAGMVTLNPSAMPGLLITACQTGMPLNPDAVEATGESAEGASPVS